MCAKGKLFMAKNSNKKSEKIIIDPEDDELVLRVKKMMEPDDKKDPTNIKANQPEVATAPEVLLQQEDTKTRTERGDRSRSTNNLQPGKIEEEQHHVSMYDETTSNIDESTITVDDSKTEEAVDDIIRSESDDLLKAEDDKLLAAFSPQTPKTAWQRLKATLADIWKNPLKRKIAISLFAVIVVLIAAIPYSRYFVLNTIGVRASLSVSVIDDSTRQPLKNVEVSFRGVSVRTDENGYASLHRIKLGLGSLKITRRAFAPIERKITVGWGSNPLGEAKLQPTGTQYKFMVKDYLSGKGIVKSEATVGEFSAFSDENGRILLTLDDPSEKISVKITSEGRRTENVTIDADSTSEHSVLMVASIKHTYISRRDGRYDIYTAYADGKGESLVLKGTGNERDDLVLAPHPTRNIVALVSTRDGEHNEDGYLLSTLDIINLDTKQVTTVQSSERIQLVDWFGDRIAYIRVVSGTSGGNPKRSRLMAYNYMHKTNNELASANYFNDVMAVGDRIYYAPSGAYQKGVNTSLFSVKADGSDRKVVLNKEVWNLFRVSFKRISISIAGEWYDFNIDGDKVTKLNGEPPNLSSRLYVNSPNNKMSLWVDKRDGKGALMIYDIDKNKDKQLKNQSGLKYPVRWLDDSTIIFRVKTEVESADYAISTDGGESRKIADVTDTDGIDRWYYY